MIVVDSSAVIAIFRGEAEAPTFTTIITQDELPQISVASVLECSIVIRSMKTLPAAKSEAWLDEFLASADVQIEPIDRDDLDLARAAHIRFGKGTGHPAQLNFGDCFSYALAKRLNARLLYKGNDFSKTDIVSALA